MDSAFFWFVLNAVTIVVLAFYSMEEMAFVSFNKVRLQFYVSQGSKRAIWLNKLLQNPTTLFATTLIGVNVATFVGSECARKFYAAIGLSPDLAPLTQIILVIVFGELAPMFAARRYSEQVALMGVPFIYLSSIILMPAIWILGLISKAANICIGGKEGHHNLFLTQDELQKVLEEKDDDRHHAHDGQEFNAITSNIFRLRRKEARDIMTPLMLSTVVSSQTTVGQLREMTDLVSPYVVVFHRNRENIIGIVFIKDLIRAVPKKKLHEFCQPPWFITLSTSLVQTLKQFRRNSENVAIVLNERGLAVGLISFDDIIDEIFEKSMHLPETSQTVVIDRTLDGKMTLRQFHEEIGIELPGSPNETLSELMIRTLEHHPESGETVSIGNCDFIVKETSLLEIKTLQLHTQVSSSDN